jgi:hypothetical protein
LITSLIRAIHVIIINSHMEIIMNELSPTQKTILEAAAQRPDGAIHPLPDSLKGGAANMVIDSLKSKGFANHADGEASTLQITDFGFKAIGMEATETSHVAEPPRTPRKSKANSKQAMVIDMMRQPEGASLAQIADITSWQPHSIRGFISGVARKKLGLAVVSEKDKDGSRIYQISPNNPKEQ